MDDNSSKQYWGSFKISSNSLGLQSSSPLIFCKGFIVLVSPKESSRMISLFHISLLIILIPTKVQQLSSAIRKN